MGTYGLKGVMRAWELEKLTTEQAIGQILQLIAEIEQRLRDLEHKYNQINRMNARSTSTMQPRVNHDQEQER